MKKSNKTIISVALSGSQGSKLININTPITNDEMIEDAYRCYLEGASIVHIHTKSADGEKYEINYESIKYIMEGIKKKCDIIVNISTSGETTVYNDLLLKGELDSSQNKRQGILELNPEMVSYDVPTMNLGEKIFVNPIPFLKKMGTRMQELSILPEIEIFDVSNIHQVKQLIQEGFLMSNPYYQLCLGVEGGIPATVKNLMFLHDLLPKNAQWSAFGIGKSHLPIMYATIALGGNIRVGLEDNLYYSYGQLTSNVELVRRAARVAKEFGNQIATPQEARLMLGVAN